MYEPYFHFKEKPFSLTPDPKFVYFSKQHQGALDHMLYGINEREGFIVIIGGIGTGKTTLCRCLINRLEENVQVALVLNPMLSDMDLLRTLVQDLGIVKYEKQEMAQTSFPRRIDDSIEDDEGLLPSIIEEEPEPNSDWAYNASKKELLDELNQFLLKQHSDGGSTVLIIDEAQNLDLRVMEQLRLLSNLETEKQKLLQIIFVGQNELSEKLELPELKQLKQRISIRYELRPLSRDEMERYINHRILVACAASRISFTPAAFKEIFNYSKGYPRLINLVCDRALLSAYNAQVDQIESKHVKRGIQSLLGEEEKNYFIRRFLTERLPLVISTLFLLLGMAFFFAGGKGGMDRLMQKDWSRFWDRAKQKVSLPASKPKDEVKTASASALTKPEVAQKTVSTPEIVEEPVKDIAGPTTPEPEEPAVSVLQPSGDNGYFRIQVHSTKRKSDAEEQLRKLKDEGFKAFMKPVTSTGKTWYVLYVGPFKKLPEARIHLSALKFSGRNPILLSISKKD